MKHMFLHIFYPMVSINVEGAVYISEIPQTGFHASQSMMLSSAFSVRLSFVFLIKRLNRHVKSHHQ